MKNFDVYGMGNALVDMEFKVKDEFLADHLIEKGLMTLVEKERQDHLLAALKGSNVGHSRACGGSAANTIIGATQLGAKTFYSCKVAQDETGEFYKNDLLANGVKSNIENGLYDGETGKCLVMISEDAERTMNTFLGTTATYSDEQLDLSMLADSKWLYMEGYLVTGAAGIAACQTARDFARKNDVKVALTFSDPGIVGFFKDGFKEMIGEQKLDLLFCNEEEAKSFTEKDSIEDAFEALKEISHAFAITAGAKGAFLYNGSERVNVSAPSVSAIDTNGAGDLFAGAFLYGITNGLDFSQAGTLACACSAKLVTQYGPRLEKEETKSILKDIL
ncbi:adenosine kinase [Halobacteriovorax sp. HFRX-2_2]|uniref:adenosine kinase n=1 Tax=unclassified Halobacteriovorax TaxID=2639665 RepID=UPI00371C56B8